MMFANDRILKLSLFLLRYFDFFEIESISKYSLGSTLQCLPPNCWNYKSALPLPTNGVISDGPLGCFHLMSVLSSAAADITVQKMLLYRSRLFG